MEFLRTVVVQDVTPAADGEVPYDLPVNSISHLNLTLKALNAGTNTKATLAQLLGALEKIEILHRGQAIHSYNGADLFALNCILLGHEPVQANIINTDNATRSLGLIIPMGRKLYNPAECFPPTKRGDLKINIKIDIADTGYDGVIFQIESTELLDASPARYLKVTTLTATPSATGEMDVALPIGNPYTGILLWGTTVPVGTAWTTTIDYAKLLADNVERYYAKANWESLHADLILRCGACVDWSEKIHLENTGASYAQNADTATEEVVKGDIENYALMDFDPALNDEFLLETSGLSELKLKINAGDTNALRALPMELVAV